MRNAMCPDLEAFLGQSPPLGMRQTLLPVWLNRNVERGAHAPGAQHFGQFQIQEISVVPTGCNYGLSSLVWINCHFALRSRTLPARPDPAHLLARTRIALPTRGVANESGREIFPGRNRTELLLTGTRTPVPQWS